MKWPSRRALGMLALLGAAASMMAMGNDEGHAPARKERANLRQVAMTSSQPTETTRHASTMERVELERMSGQSRRPDSGNEIGDAFNAVSWYVPPPPPPPPPPPQPMAPTLPFTYLGNFKNPDSPVQIIILGWAGRVYTVSEGEVINSIYRVGPVTNGVLEFTYLPLNIKQSLNTDITS